jgi:hypothetical protein
MPPPRRKQEKNPSRRGGKEKMEKRSLEIEYQKDGDAFKVVLTTKSPDIFTKASQQEDIRDKKEEELVAALIAYIRASEDKTVLWVDRYKDDKRHDGVNGEPASRIFDGHGKNIMNRHFKEGLLNDGVNGEPALQTFDIRGRLTYAASCKNGGQIKELSAQEMDDYQHQLAVKNAGKPLPDDKKPDSPAGGSKIG